MSILSSISAIRPLPSKPIDEEFSLDAAPNVPASSNDEGPRVAQIHKRKAETIFEENNKQPRMILQSIIHNTVEAATLNILEQTLSKVTLQNPIPKREFAIGKRFIKKENTQNDLKNLVLPTFQIEK